MMVATGTKVLATLTGKVLREDAACSVWFGQWRGQQI